MGKDSKKGKIWHQLSSILPCSACWLRLRSKEQKELQAHWTLHRMGRQLLRAQPKPRRTQQRQKMTRAKPKKPFEKNKTGDLRTKTVHHNPRSQQPGPPTSPKLSPQCHICHMKSILIPPILSQGCGAKMPTPLVKADVELHSRELLLEPLRTDSLRSRLQGQGCLGASEIGLSWPYHGLSTLPSRRANHSKGHENLRPPPRDSFLAPWHRP